MTSAASAAKGRRPAVTGRARSTARLSCARSPIAACTPQPRASHREHGAGLPRGHRQGLRHRVRPAGGHRRHADGVPRRQARPPGGATGPALPRARPRQPRPPPLQGPEDRASSTFAELLELVAGRVPLLVEVKAQQRTAAGGLPRDASPRQAAAYNGPIALMSFDRDIVPALGQARAHRPARAIVGSHAAAARAGGQRPAPRARMPRSRALLSCGADRHQLPRRRRATCCAAARTWMTRHAPELPLFSWTIRTPRAARDGRPLRRRADLRGLRAIDVKLGRSDPQLSLVIALSDRHSPRAQDVIGGDDVKIEVGQRVREEVGLWR